MSDDPNVGGAAPAEGTAAPAPPLPAPEANAPADKGGSLSGLLAGDGGAPVDDTPGPSWGEKWRDELAEGDEATLKILERVPSPKALVKKLLAQEQTIRRGAHKALPTLPENATDEQIAEYRKALGVPDAPEGYGIEFSKELPVDDSAKSAAKAFAEFMHSQNVPAQYTKQAFDFYQQWAAQTMQQQAAEQKRMEARVFSELEKEHGQDFERDLGILKEFGKERPGIYPVLLANVSNKAFVQDMLQLALDLAPESAFLSGEGGAGGKTPEERREELATKGVTGKRTAAEEREYEGILARQLKKEGRMDRDRAA